MQTIFEKLGGTYRPEGDYLLPNLEAPESPQIGMWGQRRLQHLRTNERVLYTTMLIGDTFPFSSSALFVFAPSFSCLAGISFSSVKLHT